MREVTAVYVRSTNGKGDTREVRDEFDRPKDAHKYAGTFIAHSGQRVRVLRELVD